MSGVRWRDWSCSVRVVVDDGRPATSRPDGPSAVAELVVRDLMDQVDTAASRFRPDSDVSRVNAAAGRMVPVQALTAELVEVALEAARRTAGACDPTLGRHLLAAGYDADIDELRARRPPTAADRPAGDPDEAPPAADWTAVRVDRALCRLGVPEGLALDLGATAKAWTADEAAARVARVVGAPALVALGGDVAVSGNGPTWPVLVSEHEEGDGQVVGLQRGGVATSSTQGRTWVTPDGDRHHVLDPRTGRPTRGPVRTATVLAASCVEANALSTAALVWGDDALARLGSFPARLVDTGGRVLTTDRWPRRGLAA